MTTDNQQRFIRAAGGLLWRRRSTGCEIAIVHRGREGRKDWTLPKGKLNDGESWQQAALREVKEETGYKASICDPAGAISYVVDGKPKVVRFWHMIKAGDAQQKTDNEEIDEVRWLPPKDALKQLDHPLERALLEASLQPPASCIGPNAFKRAWAGFFRSTSLDRLGNTLDPFEADLVTRIEQSKNRPSNVSTVRWDLRSTHLLDLARRAFHDGDAERGWRCLKAADRFMLYGLDPERLPIEARPILAEASEEEKGLSKWRRTSIQEALCENGGKLKQKLDAQDVVRAKRILDEHQDNVYQKVEILKSRLRLLCVASLAAVAAWLIEPPFLPYPSSLATATTSPRLMWLGVILSGVLGAVFSGFSSSISTDQKRARIPSELSTSSVTLARLSMAVAASLAAAIFLASGALNVLKPTYELMLAAAFAAGFSDRLLLRGIAALSK
jgi:8-oxo-dGTP pyrophosphatase MutT (NUDIX family)